MTEIPELESDQKARVAAYWWHRAESEITSWVGFGHVLEDLRAEGSPDAILALAERAVSDEYRHAAWCAEWAARFGHAGGVPTPRSTTPITFRGATDAENRLLRIALCCFTETVGCFTLRLARPTLVDAGLRKQNRQHLSDELRHARVGWGHLSTLDEARRERLRPWLPALLKLLPDVVCNGPEEGHEALVPYGYFSARLLRAAHEQALREVILPGLEHVLLRRAA